MNPEIYSRMAAIEDSHWWFRARRTILAGVIARLGLPPDARILDAGCGTGGNLAMLRSFGEVEGVEADEGAREIALAKRIAPVAQGRLPDALPFEAHRFDLVVLLDVLEHVREDEASLAALERMLKPSGYLLVTVPAYPILWSSHDEVHRHFRRYRVKELEEKVEKAGMQIAYASYFNTILFPLIAAVRLCERMRNGQGRSDLDIPSPWLNRLLYAVFSSERALLGRFALPFGVSAMVIARKGS